MSDAENNVVEQDTGEKMAEGKDAVEENKPQDEKEMEADESVESTDSPATSPAKSPAASPAKRASPKKTPHKRKADTDQNGDGETKEEEEEDEDEESSDEELVGLLDGPVKLMTGKRERKKTERLSFDTKKDVAETKFEVEEGRGTRLGDMPNVEFYISKTNSENFRALYRFFFGRPGRPHEIKRNIRKFSGFNFEKGSPEYNKKEASLIRYTMPGLREICLWLDLDKKGTKEEILDRILSFCLKPESSGRSQRKKKSQVVKKKGKKRKRKADSSGDAPKAKKARKPKKESAEHVDGDETIGDSEDEEEADDEDENETGGNEDGDQDEEEPEEPKKKKAKLDKPTPKKKMRQKKKAAPKSPKKTLKKSPVKKSTPKKASPKKKASIQITPKSATKRKAKMLSIEDSDDSSDDEPLIRKTEPSEAQIEQTIKSFLDKADLELVTMKMVCKKVYETYPDFNLVHKKDFIKATVRSIIS